MWYILLGLRKWRAEPANNYPLITNHSKKGDNMKVLSDMHIHSDNSFDAENTVLEMCQAALEKGIKIIAIPDHMEAPEIKLGDRSVFGNMIEQITSSVKDAEVANELMNGEIKVLRGMELG